MVVVVGFLGVLDRFVVHLVIVAMGQRCMIVLMRMPVGPVVPLAQDAASVMMGDMVVVVAVHHGRMHVAGLLAFALGELAAAPCRWLGPTHAAGRWGSFGVL